MVGDGGNLYERKKIPACEFVVCMPYLGETLHVQARFQLRQEFDSRIHSFPAITSFKSPPDHLEFVHCRGSTVPMYERLEPTKAELHLKRLLSPTKKPTHAPNTRRKPEDIGTMRFQLRQEFDSRFHSFPAITHALLTANSK